jgi:hypothetical protein
MHGFQRFDEFTGSWWRGVFGLVAITVNGWNPRNHEKGKPPIAAQVHNQGSSLQSKTQLRKPTSLVNNLSEWWAFSLLSSL